MATILMSRRQYLSVVGATGVAYLATGCEDNKKQNAVGQAAAVAGALIFNINHPVAKVIGAILTLAGAALSIQAQLQDGTTQEFKFNLTPEQTSKIEKGETIEVKDAKGKVTKLKATKK